MNTPVNNALPVDKTRRKRLKVVSACGECRRKKTKCNGEKPCAGCIKAKVECKYVTSANNNHNQHSNKARSAGAINAAKSHHNMKSSNSHHRSGATTSTSSSSSNNNKHAGLSVEAIEDRLSVIESILRALMRNNSESSLPAFGSASVNAPLHHAPYDHKWQHPRFASYPITPTPLRPFQLPPLLRPPLTTSSSTSSACSLSSSSSTSTVSSSSGSTTTGSSAPTTIRDLLNDDEPVTLPSLSTTLPTPPPTATFKEPPFRYHHQPYFVQDRAMSFS